MDVLAVVGGLVGCVPSQLDACDAQVRLGDVARVRGWLDGVEAQLAARLDVLRRDDASSLDVPAAVSAAQRSSRPHGERARRRGRTLGSLPGLGDALAKGEASGEHVDAVAGALSGLPAEQRRQVAAAHGDTIAELARGSTPADLSRAVRGLADEVAREAGVSRRERQRRDVRLRMWTDRHTQMVHVSGRFDPASGVRLQQRLDHVIERCFHDRTPPDCPEDPGERHDFLRAHALLRLINGEAAGGTPEVVVIVDDETLLGGVRHADSHVDVPGDVDDDEITVDDIRGWASQQGARVTPVRVDADGVVVVLGASMLACDLLRRGGERWAWDPTMLARSLAHPQWLDLARRARVASRAQRVALRVMHATCIVPDCAVRYEHTEPHHVAWFTRDGGSTDLANLGPLCSCHHHAVHDHGWVLRLGRDRSVEVLLPDGRVLRAGSPRQRHLDRQRPPPEV